MATFAQMSGDYVSNIVVGDSKEDLAAILGGVFIEYTNENPAGIGWIYNKETNTFSAPVVEEIVTEGETDA